jgi:hypothetical protein
VDAIRFEVAYRFPEYRRYVLAHAAGIRGTQGLLWRTLLSIMAAVAFIGKTRTVGKCAFTIDETGVRRRSKDGEMLVPWKNVTNVYRYEPGYLIEKGKGAMPIPYRCLDAAQRETLEALFAAHLPRP